MSTTTNGDADECRQRARIQRRNGDTLLAQQSCARVLEPGAYTHQTQPTKLRG
jgi:hypothetical protein